jgi:hypothetical protein
MPPVAVSIESNKCSWKTFFQKAVDSINEFDRLSAASTEMPLKQSA